MPAQQLVASYERVVAKNPDERTLRDMICGASEQIKEPPVRAWLEKLARLDSEIGEYARDRLSA